MAVSSKWQRKGCRVAVSPAVRLCAGSVTLVSGNCPAICHPSPRSALTLSCCLLLGPCSAVFFHRATFVTQLTAAVRDLGHFRSGTNLCAAALHTLSTLAAKALTLVPPSATRTGADTARGNEAATAAATPACCAAALTVAGSSQRHSLVLLTDGAADDAYELLSAVLEQLGDPPFPDGGFRALLVSGAPGLSGGRGWVGASASLLACLPVCFEALWRAVT